MRFHDTTHSTKCYTIPTIPAETQKSASFSKSATARVDSGLVGHCTV